MESELEDVVELDKSCFSRHWLFFNPPFFCNQHESGQVDNRPVRQPLVIVVGARFMDWLSF